MLTNTMLEKLNEQINIEFYSSNLYLQMSAWCDDKGFSGASIFLKKHAEEERQHMERLFNYVTETGGLPLLGTIEAPPHDFASLSQVFHQTLEHEYFVTRKINELAQVALETQDYSTFHFLQWYVSEQHEEEHLFKGLVDKLALVGEDGKGMYFFDKELSKLAQEPENH